MAYIGTCKQCGDSYRFADDENAGTVRCLHSSLPLNCLLDLEQLPEDLLFFDVETTGLIDFKSDKMAPHQPRVIQLAALLVNDKGEELDSLNVYIKPDGWIVPEAASRIHGITTEKCLAEGVPMKEALDIFNHLMAKACVRFAYNNSYDEFLMDRESRLYDSKPLTTFVKPFDVMELAKDFCQLPPTEKMIAAGYTGFKPPKLIEACEKAFGLDFNFNAHDAMADVRVTKELYFYLNSIHQDKLKGIESQANNAEPFIRQQD